MKKGNFQNHCGEKIAGRNIPENLRGKNQEKMQGGKFQKNYGEKFRKKF